MKTLLITLSVGLFVTAQATAAFGQTDASFKTDLLGYWQSPRHTYLLKSNGIMYMDPFTEPVSSATFRWDVRGGLFYQEDEALKIITINKCCFVYQSIKDASEVFVFYRLTKAEARRR
jgi:hypothetical protein